MARRRRGERVEVELVPDGPEGGGPAAADGPGELPGVDRRLAARWGALSRRTRVLVAAVAVAAVLVPLGSAAVLDAAEDRERAATMPGMPGGVADLSVAPEPGWEVAVDEGVLTPLPGGGILTRDGRDVVAVDAATGAERWRHELGALAECGPPDGDLEPGDRLVCLAGPPDDRTVTVLGVDGAVLGTRDLGAVESAGTQVPGVQSVDGYTDEQSRRSLPSVRPAADGALVVLEPGRGFVQAGDEDEARRALDALRPEDLPVLRVVDALTGDVRGEAVPRPRTLEDLSGCGDAQQGWVGELEQPVVGTSGPFAWVAVCSVVEGLTTGGEPVDLPRTTSGWFVWPVDGGLALATASGARVVRGDRVVELPGLPLPAWADDGSSDTVVTESREQTVVGAAPDGTPRWEVGVELGLSGRTQLARTAGTVVLGVDDLVGLDLATGQERWRRDDVLPAPEESDRRVVGSLTDGRTVVLGLRRADGFDLVALDAESGRTVWESAHDGRPLAALRAVEGQAVAVLQDVPPSVRVGGRSEAGVATSDTVLRGLSTG